MNTDSQNYVSSTVKISELKFKIIATFKVNFFYCAWLVSPGQLFSNQANVEKNDSASAWFHHDS